MRAFSEACERNKGPILERLLRHFVAVRVVLEVGSGTGQHAVHFSRALAHLRWHPTERAAVLADLAERITSEGPANLAIPLALDVNDPDWPVTQVDGVFSANTLHIMDWPAVVALFAGVGRVLGPGGVLCVYGPFRYGERYTSQSNADFDRLLTARDPASGLREFAAVDALARQAGLEFRSDESLPAHNQLLTWTRGPA